MKCSICNSVKDICTKDLDRVKYSYLPEDICSTCIRKALKPSRQRYCPTCGKVELTIMNLGGKNGKNVP